MKTNKKKGISLIVLIITIVVMVILAGAIILALTDDDIINNSKEAVNKSDFSNLKEAAQTQYGSWQLAKKLNKTDKSAKEYVEDKLIEQGFTEEELEFIKITEDNKVYIYDYPEIPEGFTASIFEDEDAVPEGFVIYKTDAATLASYRNRQEEAQKTFDQFVWIPVLDMKDFVRTNWNNNAPTVEMGSNYTEPSSYNGSTAYQYPTEVAEYNAMKASVEKHGGFYVARYEAGDGDVTSARTTYTTGAHTVVSKKGAFVYNWVTWGKTAKDIVSDVVYNNEDRGKGAVYLSQNIYKDESNKNYTTNLIYGVQWDATLRWLSDKYNVTDSRNWGNHGNSTEAAATNSGKANMNYTTGRNEAWKAKNIYDLAGNLYEWTMEIYYNEFRIRRGGNYAGGNAASRDVGYITALSYDYWGFRPVLYLN